MPKWQISAIKCPTRSDIDWTNGGNCNVISCITGWSMNLFLVHPKIASSSKFPCLPDKNCALVPLRCRPDRDQWLASTSSQRSVVIVTAVSPTRWWNALLPCNCESLCRCCLCRFLPMTMRGEGGQTHVWVTCVCTAGLGWDGLPPPGWKSVTRRRPGGFQEYNKPAWNRQLHPSSLCSTLTPHLRPGQSLPLFTYQPLGGGMETKRVTPHRPGLSHTADLQTAKDSLAPTAPLGQLPRRRCTHKELTCSVWVARSPVYGGSMYWRTTEALSPSGTRWGWQRCTKSSDTAHPRTTSYTSFI